MDRRATLFGLAVATALVAVACGGNGASGPTAAGSVVVQGVVVGEDATVTSAAAVHAASSKNNREITVRVDGTDISTTVSANGTFELELGSGSFTLVFERDGTVLGTVVVTAQSGTVKIVVRDRGVRIEIVDLTVEEDGDGDASGANPGACAIAGGKEGRGIEIEGLVSGGSSASFQMTLGDRSTAPVQVNAGTASFSCNGKETNDCRGTVGPGARVHVRGRLDTCSPPVVTAYEVKVQKAG